MDTDASSSITPSEYLDDERFNRTFTLPRNPDRPGEIRLTYADFGHPGNDRVLLVCPPLVGSRFLLVTKDKLAKQHGVRIISPDRPGFGGTTDVPPPERVGLWLEIVETLLRHLEIKHVSVLGYSAGAVYAMNVLLRQRHLLHPDRPFVALCAPWVHTSHSDVTSLKLAKMLPNSLIGGYDKLLSLVGNMVPAIQFSNDLTGLIPSLSWGTGSVGTETEPASEDVAFEEKITSEVLNRITNGNVRGISQDALLLLKRDDFPGCWGGWSDWDTLVPMLAQAERGVTQNSDASETTRKLKVQVFYAESDHIIGTKVAPAWLDECWRPEQRGDRIDYSSEVIAKTSHDHILDLRFGVIERILREMRGRD